MTTAAVPNFLVTREGVSDEIAYGMTKACSSTSTTLVAAHSAAAGIKLENALKGMPIPLHPGAERYYKEKNML